MVRIKGETERKKGRREEAFKRIKGEKQVGRKEGGGTGEDKR